jgi:hypothetical protein
LELLNDYDCSINYHPGKENVVADALSRRATTSEVAAMFNTRKELLLDMDRAGIELAMEGVQSYLGKLTLEPTLLEQIRVAQLTDDELIKIREEVVKGGREDFSISEDGTLKYQNCLCVPKEDNLRKEILTEANQSLYTIHPGSTEMYRDLRERYWWNGMKKEVAQFVERCLTFQRVKAEHKKSARMLKPFPLYSKTRACRFCTLFAFDISGGMKKKSYYYSSICCKIKFYCQYYL